MYIKVDPDLSTLLVQLYSLLLKNRPSGPDQHCTFQQVKKQLLPSSILVHYYDKHLLFAADESPYIVSGVLSYHVEGRSEEPIA